MDPPLFLPIMIRRFRHALWRCLISLPYIPVTNTIIENRGVTCHMCRLHTYFIYHCNCINAHTSHSLNSGLIQRMTFHRCQVCYYDVLHFISSTRDKLACQFYEFILRIYSLVKKSSYNQSKVNIHGYESECSIKFDVPTFSDT